MCLENLKVLHELSKFRYYKIANWLNLTFTKLIFPNYLERSTANTYLAVELRNLFIY
jgi:hypothetical protein